MLSCRVTPTQSNRFLTISPTPISPYPQRYRKELQAAQESSDPSNQGLGLRQRKGEGRSGAGAGSAADEEDDDTTGVGADGRGFPLWQLLLVAFIMFLLGRVSSGMF